MPHSNAPEKNNAASTAPTSHLAGILGTAVVLALLYFGRDVLIPITLAILLSFLVAPMLRTMRKVGIGQTTSVWVSVLALTLGIAAAGTVIGTQLIKLASSLPEYEETIHDKLATLRELTDAQFDSFTGHADKVFSELTRRDPERLTPSEKIKSIASNNPDKPVIVEIQEPPLRPLQLLQKIMASVWPPIEMAGIVLMVLIFVLLEHESLRDRLIRLIGNTDIRATTIAVNDAGERLSRFFTSQFAVNFGVGFLIFVGLSVISLPHAILFGTLTAILRFVPYVGVWLAAISAILLAAAIEPGWSLALMTFVIFFSIEMVVAQLIEPQLYGHSTGLSPLSVVIAAIFWSWIWGPVGLVVSTPLTLCLVVAGRYIPALQVLEILFGEVRALTLAQNFYQRALSGDATEIITAARTYMKRKSFASYCDSVLMPALHLAGHDLDEGKIHPEEKLRLGMAIGTVIESLDGKTHTWKKSDHASFLQEMSLGKHLRTQREKISGPRQGSLDVPPGSVVLCVGLGDLGNELATEILVRVLRHHRIDARHITPTDLTSPPPPGAKPESISAICVVSTSPSKEVEQSALLLANLRQRFSSVNRVLVLLPSPYEHGHFNFEHTKSVDNANEVARSYETALNICIASLHKDLPPA